MNLENGFPSVEQLEALLDRIEARTALIPRSKKKRQEKNSTVHVLLTSNEYSQAVSYKETREQGLSVRLLIVDHELFERDIKESALGEYTASRLITPYIPLIGEKELTQLETTLKRRTIVESLENLVLEYSTLAAELIISKEYFPYADLHRLSRAYPVLRQQFSQATTEDSWDENLEQMMGGYIRALEELQKEGKVSLADGSARICDEYLHNSLKRSNDLVEILGSIQKAARPFVLAGRAIAANPLSVAKQITENAMEDPFAFMKTPFQLEEPGKFLFLDTGKEILPISRKLTIDDFLTKIGDGKKVSEVRQEHLFGFLNSVDLLSVRLDNTWRRFVIKTFLDWYGYKWFPLAIWTLGVQDFAVAGKKRMANEYTISQVLKREGFNVPDIYDISWRERLIFEKFIEGETLGDMVSDALIQGFSKAQMGVLHLAGETVGRVHKLNLCLGDCKPENMIYSEDKEIYLIDLEQARIGGNPAWDIAEFLYFSTLFTPNPKREAVRELAVNFLRGYLESYDRVEHLIEAGKQKYYSVFAPFEPIWVLSELSRICQDPLEKDLDEFYGKMRDPAGQVSN